MRSIEIRYHKDEGNEGLVYPDNPMELDKVIGYLSLWAIHSSRYKKLTIYIDSHNDVHATYFDAEGEVAYIMFGQRGEDGVYSTHS